MSLTYNSTGTPITYDITTEEIISYTDKEEHIKEAQGIFDVMPNIDQHFENVFVVGASGSGKSYWTASYALSYRRIFPKKNIFMFSQKTSDPSFEERTDKDGNKIDIKSILKLRRIKVDDSFLNKNIDVLKDFNDCLIIFDDFMYYDNKKLVDKICSVITQVLTLGRTPQLYCVITAHLIYQMKNKDMYMNLQNEIHKLVWFNGVNTFQLYYCLKNYWGISKKQINMLLHIEPSKKYQFTCLNKVPLYVITDHRCILLS